MADKIKNVFISHIHEDDAGLRSLKELLEARGYTLRDASVTADSPNNAKNPDYIKSAILAPGITWAGALLVYITPNTKDSEWVNWEIECAAKQGKPVIGVWGHGSGDCDAPKALDDYATAVEVGWNADEIIDALEGRLTGWRNPDGKERPERPIKKANC